MSLGPLQVLIVNFDEANFAGQIQAEVSRLEEAGVLRARKVLVVAKTEAGDIEVMRTMGEREPGTNLSDDEQAVAEALEPGSAAAIAVLEHTWALQLGAAIGSAAAIAVLEHTWAHGLRAAIERAGGHHVVAEWANAEDLAAMGVTLTS